MELFKIGSLDITRHITVPSYKVNMIPKYTEWTDSNYTVHRDINRQRVEGNFTVKFFNIEDYEAFIRAIRDNTSTDGSTFVTVYTQNTRTTKQTYVFIDYDPKNSLPIIGRSDDDGFDVSISER